MMLTTSHDLHEIINAYSDDVSYLTDGRVKTTDKPTSQCAWTNGDVAEWLRRTGNAPEAQVFRGIFTAAFAPLDDEAKPLTERYTADAIQANPSFAPAYFYAAVGTEKIATFKALAYSGTQRSTYYDHLIDLWSRALQLNPSIERAHAERAEDYLELKSYSQPSATTIKRSLTSQTMRAFGMIVGLRNKRHTKDGGDHRLHPSNRYQKTER